MLQCVGMELMNVIADAYGMAEVAFKLQFSVFSGDNFGRRDCSVIQPVVVFEFVSSCRLWYQYPVFSGMKFLHLLRETLMDFDVLGEKFLEF